MMRTMICDDDESNGMILMAEDKEGKLHFVQPENAIPAGSKVS